MSTWKKHQSESADPKGFVTFHCEIGVSILALFEEEMCEEFRHRAP